MTGFLGAFTGLLLMLSMLNNCLLKILLAVIPDFLLLFVTNRRWVFDPVVLEIRVHKFLRDLSKTCQYTNEPVNIPGIQHSRPLHAASNHPLEACV